MSAGLFVTGTDTDSGKTVVAATLVRMLRDQGIRVAGFKPVAAGASVRDGKLRNDDALTLLAAGEPGLDYDDVNPVCFAPAIAPHLAAAEKGEEIGAKPILDAYARLRDHVDVVIAEGAGGWMVPLGGGLDIAGLAGRLRLPVLMVVGLRLGCINHARLTEQAIAASGASLAGWVGSQVDPHFDRLAGNLETLNTLLDAPCLGVLPYLVDGDGTDLTALLDLQRVMAAVGLTVPDRER
jgi:dethiobiotin synthetase